jgi:hypothetical protein
MKMHTLFGFIILITGATPALGQKIETQAQGHAAITRVETALNHLTVIQLSEPVLSIAAGSQTFKVEWRENKVFVEPTEANVSTNLFIWTKSGRLNYELEPAGEVQRMDFAIDQPPINPPAVKSPPAAADPPSHKTVDEPALLGGKPVWMWAFKAKKNTVQLLIKDLFQQDNHLYIRYAVANLTNRAYEIGIPQVFLLESPRGPKGVIAHRNSQLTDSEAAKVESVIQVSLDVIRGETRSAQVKPGEQTVGVVEVKAPASDRNATILRLVLTDKKQEQIGATLIL